jgi:hypothetical protein
MDSVRPIAEAITEGFKLLSNILAGADKRRVRKLIDSGEKYILTNENPSISGDKKEKLLNKYKTDFFNLN